MRLPGVFRRRQNRIFLWFALMVALAFWFLYSANLSKRPSSFFQLLENRETQILSARFYFLYAQPPLSIHITNVETLNYLAQIISNSKEGSVSGFSHHISIRLMGGREFDLECTVADDGQKLAIVTESGVFSDSKYRTVALTKDSPEELKNALQNLIKAQASQ